MRYDFIFEPSEQKESIRMPFLNRLMREQKAIPFKLEANPPTVTLPRLKVINSMKNYSCRKANLVVKQGFSQWDPA